MKSSSLTAPSVNIRHYGIDLLRILSMLMVLILHILGHGGILDATLPGSPHYIAAWVLECAVFCAVNCYALITGYVMINGKYRYTNLVLLWLQVVLINIVGKIPFYLADPSSVNIFNPLISLFPASRMDYWYFSSYFFLYLLIPVLNHAIHSINRRQAKVLCIIIIVAFSILPTVMNVDASGLGDGYSTIWLMLMYLLGACIRKFGFGTNIKSWILIVGYALSVLVSVVFLLLLPLDIFSILRIVWDNDMLIQYISPTVLFCGIALLLLFLRIHISRQWIIKIIQLLSPVSFGVYILHCQAQIVGFLFKEKRFAAFIQYPIPLMIGAVLLSAVVLFLLFAAIDKLRLMLFDALKLKKRLLALEEKYIGDLWARNKTEK